MKTIRDLERARKLEVERYARLAAKIQEHSGESGPVIDQLKACIATMEPRKAALAEVLLSLSIIGVKIHTIDFQMEAIRNAERN